jgi:hypothetical protein
MKFGDLFNKAVNTKNKQVVLTVKKKLIASSGYNLEDVMRMKLKKKYFNK